MPFSLARLRAFLFEIPTQGKLAYGLLRDDRVPRAPKAALLAAVGLIVSPIDLPAWIPVIGELDMLALGVLAVKVFVEACPEEFVLEHRRAMDRGESIFDRDLRAGVAGARDAALGALGRGRGRGASHRPRVGRRAESA